MIDKHSFNKGLNIDISPAYTPPDQYRNAENIRVASSYAGDIGEVMPVEGNRLIDYTSIYPIVRGQVIGAYEDRKSNKVYYFVWTLEEMPNQDSQITVTEVSKILCLDMDTEIITTLVSDYEIEGELNFRENSFVASAYAGGVLYFTDNINEPRKLEVTAILAEEFSVEDVEDLGIGAIPGHFPLGIEKVNAADAGITTRNLNNTLIDNAFQFSYRYIYEDNSVSTLAPYSKLADYEDDDGDKDKDAVIITLPFTEQIPARVRKIQFCAREGNAGDFFIFNEINGDTNTGESQITQHRANTKEITVNFFNDRLGIALSSEYSSKAFDLIPKTAKALDIGSDRVFMGNITLGYDKVEAPNLAATFVDAGTEFDTLAQAWIYHVYFPVREEFGVLYYDHFALAVIDQDDDFKGIYYISPAINGNVNTFVRDVITTQNPIPFIDGIEDMSIAEVTLSNTHKISSDPNDVVKSQLTQSTTLALLSNIGSIIGDTVSVYGSNTMTWTQSNFAKIPAYGLETNTGGSTDSPVGLIEGKHFKSGGRYKIGVVYYDKYNRNAGVSTNDSCIVDVPHRLFTNSLFYQGISWDLSTSGGSIPIWATHYGIVRTKNLLTQSFIQTVVYDIKYAELDTSGVYVFETAFDVDNTIGLAINIDRLPKENIGYSFTQGDRIRMIMNDEGVIEAGVIGQYGKYIITDYKEELTYSTVSTGTVIAKLEIFTPAEESYTESFYEVGSMYSITNPGTPDRNFSVAQGVIPGDVHLKERIPKNAQSYKVEAMSINDDKWFNWLQDTGRINVVLQEDGESILPNTIVYSNTYVQSTKVNGLSSYDLLDRGEVDERGGEINFLQYTSSTNDSENVLLAICSNNTHSLYIGQTRVVDDAGNAILATSGQVIGTINTLKGDYGTQNPESVVMSRAGVVYWFDLLKKQIIRYTNNGLTEVGVLGVTSYLKEAGRNNGVYRFVGGYDPRHNEYLLNVIDATIPSVLADQLDYFIAGFIHEYTDEFTVYGNMSGISKIVKSSLLYMPARTTYKIEVYQSDSNSSTFILDNQSRNIIRTGSAIFQITNYDYVPRLLNVKNTGAVAINILEEQFNWHEPTDANNKCLVYSEDMNAFVGFRTFNPDFMTPINNSFISFFNGKPYIHDSSINTFYGTKYDSNISFVSNNAQNVIPIIRGISIESKEKPKYIHIRTENPYLQSTDIYQEEITTREGAHYAEVKRDRLFPDDNYDNNLNFGQPVKGALIYVHIKYDGRDGINLRYANCKLQASIGHNNLIPPQ